MFAGERVRSNIMHSAESAPKAKEEVMADPREVAARWMEAFNAHDEAGMSAPSPPLTSR
jgi:hypothetical protein